jgi:hypothetical protein
MSAGSFHARQPASSEAEIQHCSGKKKRAGRAVGFRRRGVRVGDAKARDNGDSRATARQAFGGGS